MFRLVANPLLVLLFVWKICLLHTCSDLFLLHSFGFLDHVAQEQLADNLHGLRYVGSNGLRGDRIDILWFVISITHLQRS